MTLLWEWRHCILVVCAWWQCRPQHDGMDIRNYFKGDDGTSPPKPPPPPPKSPPRPTILELPDFLFISAASGVKRSRSTVAENVDDIDHSDNFDSNLHRVLSPLEVRVMPTTKPQNEKPATEKSSNENTLGNTNTTKRRKSKANKDDGFYFTDDLDDRLAHKEKQKKDKEEEIEGKNKKRKSLKSSKDSDKFSEQPKPLNNSTSNKPSPIPSVSHTTPPAVTTTKTPPPKPQPASPTLKLPQNVAHTRPIKKIDSPTVSIPPKKVVVDLELEEKITDKMESVQLWQNKCSELRKQVYLSFRRIS